MSRLKYYIILTMVIILFSDHLMGQHTLIKLSENLTIKKISENIYVHISYYDLQNYKHFPANGLVIKENEKAYIIDTPWTDDETRTLITWIKDSLKVQVEGVIVTHWHIDCMGGLNEIKKQKIISYANQMTIDIAKSKNLPLPDTGFQDSLEIRFGDQKIVCKYFGAGHTIDNCVVWLPQEKILFAGCPAKALRWKGLGFTGDADLIAWPKTLQKLLDTYPDSQAVVPGHGDIGGKDIIYHTLDLLKKHQSMNKK